MDKKKPGRSIPSIECFISTGSKLVPLDAGCEGLVLPGEPPTGAAPVTYGQYLGSVAGFLSANSHRALRRLLRKQVRSSGGAQARVSTASPSPREAGASACPGRRSRAPSLEAASGIELISEKHGALYSVSRLRVRFADNVRSFAVNCAFSPEQQAFLQVEVKLLTHLNARFGLPWLPLPFMSAKASIWGT